MAFQVVSRPETWYDPADTVMQGMLSRQVGWEAVVELYDADTQVRKWEYHCYGVEPPDPLPTDRYPGITVVRHPPSLWPEVITNSPALSGLIFTQVLEAEMNVLVV